MVLNINTAFFLGIFAPYAMNLGYNQIQMVLLIIISIVPLVGLKCLPKKYFPFCVFIISIVLLYRTSLITNHVWGADINAELYLANMVLRNHFWDLSIPENLNTTLSIVILAPIYSLYLEMNTVWIFKIVYPFLFSLVPLGLYDVYRKQTNEKIAFLAWFFFVAFFAFYTVMPALARQQIAGLFITSIIMLFIDKNISNLNKTILLVVFGASVAVSHYGVAYLFIFMMIIAAVISYSPLKQFILPENKKFHFNNNYVLFLSVFSIAWFMNIAGASVFGTGVGIGHAILSSITDLLNPMAAQGLYIAVGNLPFFQSIERYLHLLAQVFIAIGLIKLLKDRNLKFYLEYKLLSTASFILVSFGIILPFFAAALNSCRLYHTGLFFLAPFFVIGFKAFFEFTSNLTGKSIKIEKNKIYALIGIFLVVYFLFNSAFIYQVFDQPKMGRFALQNNIDFPYINDQESSAIDWLSKHNDPDIKVFADINKAIFFQGMNHSEIRYWNLEEVKDSYKFLGTFNINNEKLLVPPSEYIDPFEFGYNKSKIYDNKGSKIFLGEINENRDNTSNNKNWRR